MGMFAVIVCVPFFRTAVDKPEAMSERVELAQVDVMVVPVTTGFTVETRLKVPFANGIAVPLSLIPRVIESNDGTLAMGRATSTPWGFGLPWRLPWNPMGNPSVYA
jgi:hypothetical protein